MNIKFPIWGIKPNEKRESLLYTKCISLKEAEKIIDLLETKYKCTECRVQILDLNSPIQNDFVKSINI